MRLCACTSNTKAITCVKDDHLVSFSKVHKRGETHWWCTEEAAALHETPYGPAFKHFGNTCDIYDGGIIISVATEFW